MNKAEQVKYEIQFKVIYGEEIKTDISKRTAKRVAEMIIKEMESLESYYLHKMGYDETDYNKDKEILNKMLGIAKSYC
jgi:hypothetical protein